MALRTIVNGTTNIADSFARVVSARAAALTDLGRTVAFILAAVLVILIVGILAAFSLPAALLVVALVLVLLYFRDRE